MIIYKGLALARSKASYEDIGRIRAGELYETSFSTGKIFDRIIEEYLEIFGVESYMIIDSFVVQGNHDSFNVYTIYFAECYVVGILMTLAF